jgi:hypothetical protein
MNSLLDILLNYLNNIERKRKAGSLKDLSRNNSFHDSIGIRFLQKFLNKNTFNRDVYHDLMPFKLGEI